MPNVRLLALILTMLLEQNSFGYAARNCQFIFQSPSDQLRRPAGSGSMPIGLPEAISRARSIAWKAITEPDSKISDMLHNQYHILVERTGTKLRYEDYLDEVHRAIWNQMVKATQGGKLPDKMKLPTIDEILYICDRVHELEVRFNQ